MTPRASYARPLARDRRDQALARVLHIAGTAALMLVMAGAALQAARMGLAIATGLPTVLLQAEALRGM